MRTTLNVDDDLAGHLAARARERRTSLSRVVNDLLRAGLRASEEGPPKRPYRPQLLDSGRPLLDVTDVSGTLEALEHER